MRQASKRIPESAEKTVRDIRRATRRHHSAEEKIRIVLEGLRGEDSIAELCREKGPLIAVEYTFSDLASLWVSHKGLSVVARSPHSYGVWETTFRSKKIRQYCRTLAPCSRAICNDRFESRSVFGR